MVARNDEDSVLRGTMADRPGVTLRPVTPYDGYLPDRPCVTLRPATPYDGYQPDDEVEHNALPSTTPSLADKSLTGSGDEPTTTTALQSATTHPTAVSLWQMQVPVWVVLLLGIIIVLLIGILLVYCIRTKRKAPSLTDGRVVKPFTEESQAEEIPLTTQAEDKE